MRGLRDAGHQFANCLHAADGDGRLQGGEGHVQVAGLELVLHFRPYFLAVDGFLRAAVVLFGREKLIGAGSRGRGVPHLVEAVVFAFTRDLYFRRLLESQARGRQLIAQIEFGGGGRVEVGEPGRDTQVPLREQLGEQLALSVGEAGDA